MVVVTGAVLYGQLVTSGAQLEIVLVKVVETVLVVHCVPFPVGVGVPVGLETEVVEDSTRGVQLGRVKVGEFPEPPSTIQFLAQAASPEVLEVCQHSDPSELDGKYPLRSSLQFPG
jgi:hypothetical protein